MASIKGKKLIDLKTTETLDSNTFLVAVTPNGDFKINANDVVNNRVIVGEAFPSTIPVSTSLKFAGYYARTAGTYTNFKDSEGNPLVITTEELDSGSYFELWGSNNIWSKHEVSIPDATSFLKTADLQRGRENEQLFNKASFIPNQSITSAGTLSTTSGAKCAVIQLDPPETSLVYSPMTIGSSAKRWRYEDASGELVGSFFGQFDTPTKIVPIPPESATQVRFCFKSASDPDSVADTIMVNYGTVALPYQTYDPSAKDYVQGIDDDVIAASILLDDATFKSGEAVPKMSDVPSITVETIPSAQLFDKTNFVPNQAINATGATSTATGAKCAIIIMEDSETSVAVGGLTITGSAKRFRFENSAGVLMVGQFGLLDASTKIIPKPSGAYQMRFCFKSASDAESVADDVMVNYGTEVLPYEEYGADKNYVTEINNYPLSLKSEETSVHLVAYGDSTTYGADLTTPATNAWTKLLSDRMLIPVTNKGSSGGYAEEITARLGGISPKIKITGGIIPASGTVTISYQDVNPIRSGTISTLSVTLVLPDGTRVNGDLISSGFRVSGLSSPISVGTNNIDVYSQSGRDDAKGSVVLIGQGYNNKDFIEAGTQTVEDIQRFYRSATSSCDNFFVWGVLDRGLVEQEGTVVGNYFKSLELWLTQEYGVRYIPVRKYLSSAQALEDAKIYNPSFTPTTEDLDLVAAKTVPRSFRVSFGSVHLNEMGHWLQALFMYKWLRYYM